MIKRISLTLRRTMGNIDFNISGIPDEAVKRSQNFNILQLIRRITSHPQQEAVQNDLEKQQSFNAFSNESKVAIMDAGNIEISEIVNVEPKWQCKVCLNHCSTGVIHCVCGTSYDKRFGRESKVYLSHPRHFLHTEFLHQKEPTTRSQVWKITRLQRILYGESTSKDVERKSMKTFTTDSSATRPSGRR